MIGRLLLIWVALAAFGRAGELPPEGTWRIWFEAKSAHAPVANPIPGAERTEWVAGLPGRGRPGLFLEAGFCGVENHSRGLREPGAAECHGGSSDAAPAYTRNRKKVIEYAELHSDQPIVASAVVAPGFLKLFKDTLGEKVFVIIPNRFKPTFSPRSPAITRITRRWSSPLSERRRGL